MSKARLVTVTERTGRRYFLLEYRSLMKVVRERKEKLYVAVPNCRMLTKQIASRRWNLAVNAELLKSYDDVECTGEGFSPPVSGD